MNEARDTIYNGASREAAAAIESVRPPTAVWHAWHARIPGGWAYKLTALGITGAAICGPMGTDVVATAIFDQDGHRVPHAEITRLDTEDNGYSAFGWRCTQDYEIVRHLLIALARPPSPESLGAGDAARLTSEL